MGSQCRQREVDSSVDDRKIRHNLDPSHFQSTTRCGRVASVRPDLHPAYKKQSCDHCSVG